MIRKRSFLGFLAALSSLSCASAPARSATPRAEACQQPFEIIEAQLPPPPPAEAPGCDDLSWTSERPGRLTLHGRGAAARHVDGDDAIATEDVGDDIVIATVSSSRDIVLQVPGRPSIRIGAAPPSARQWSLEDVIPRPEGWWVVSWAAWVGDDFSERPPALQLFFIRRDDLRVFEAASILVLGLVGSTTPTPSGLVVRLTEPAQTLVIRWKQECLPRTARPRPSWDERARCRSRAVPNGYSFGRG